MNNNYLGTPIYGNDFVTPNQFNAPKNGFDLLNFTYRIDNNKPQKPISFEVNAGISSLFSGGKYTNSNYNSFGFEEVNNLNFVGDLSKYFSSVFITIIRFTGHS